MSARRTKHALWAEVADALVAGIPRPDLAAKVLALPKSGPKSARDADGFTAPQRARAALWIEMHKRTDDGEEEADVLDDTARDKKVTWDYVDRLFRLQGEPDVRRLLEMQGHLERCNVGSFATTDNDP